MPIEEGDNMEKLKFEHAEQVNWEYDEGADVLYISFGKPRKALSFDLGSGIVLRYSKESKEVVGFTIVGLKEILKPELSETTSS